MLTLQIYETATRGRMLADFSRRAAMGGGLTFSTNAHGFAGLSAPLVPMSLSEAFQVYEWPGLPHVVLSDEAAAVAWEGRLEDIGIVPGGVSLTALGYQRAYSDAPYTALWSKTGTADWREVTTEERSGTYPARYEMDNNNRVYIAPRKGELYANDTHYGELTFALPHLGARDMVTFAADYSIILPAGWNVRVLTCDYDFGNVVSEASVTATGSAQTGTFTLSTSARQRVIFSVRNLTGSNSTITGDTGSLFARLTAIRIKTTANSAVLASDIGGSVAAYVDAINTLQVYSGVELITATATDLKDESYEDAYPADILSRLAFLHSYEWSVWEGRRLQFRPKGSGGRRWYVDVTQFMELQRSLDNVRNSGYGVYRSAAGATMRTAVADDAASAERYGVARRGSVSVQSTSQSEAETHRDLWLSDHAAHQARARVTFDRLYDASGNQWPLYMLRAGDRLTLRNLSPAISTSVDEIRTFVVGETSYDAAAGAMEFTPEEATPTLDRLVARREAGLNVWQGAKP